MLTKYCDIQEKYEVAPIALALNESLLAIALAYGNIMPTLSCFHTSQNLIQAVPPSGSPLLQLPYITPAIARRIEDGNSKVRFSVQRFMRMPDEQRRELAVGPGLLSESQYQAAMVIARQIPALKVEKAFFKVMGERFITPNSLVQFVVKARVVPPGVTSLPEVSEADLEDIDPEEGDLNALLGRKTATSPSSLSGKSKGKPASGRGSSSEEGEEKKVQPALAFAPYFARDHSPRWHIFLADSKQGKIVVPPRTFTGFDQPLFNDDNDDDGKAKGNSNSRPTLAIQTFKMQFQAPPQAGQYTFVMHLLCDCYIGTDLNTEVTLEVEEMARAEGLAGEDDISEPDEGMIMHFISHLHLPLSSILNESLVITHHHDNSRS